MEEEIWARRGWMGGGGGGGCNLKIFVAKGGTIFICNYFFGGKF